MKEVVFQSQGMSCFTCEKRIKTAALYLDGVLSCEANCVNGQIFCEYDENIVTKEEIAKRLQEMGYEVIES